MVLRVGLSEIMALRSDISVFISGSFPLISLTLKLMACTSLAAMSIEALIAVEELLDTVEITFSRSQVAVSFSVPLLGRGEGGWCGMVGVERDRSRTKDLI